ncbi:MAG: hypothetical protein Q7T57_02445, partial [Dehalococcoidales bacterium]|nr:hypothetical protein [Dehalococcoidales bacterium]
ACCSLERGPLCGRRCNRQGRLRCAKGATPTTEKQKLPEQLALHSRDGLPARSATVLRPMNWLRGEARRREAPTKN